MSSRLTIEFDFQKAIGQAKELEELAGKLLELSKRSLPDVLGSIRGSWEGENANKFLTKGNLMREEVEKTSAELKEIASDIRQIAQNIYDAEMAALAIIEARSYEL